MIITRDALVEEHACSDGLEFFDTHFPAGEGTQEEVFEALAKYAPTTSWQAWLAGHLGLTATCRSWYPDGKPWLEDTYVAGNLHGLCRTWHPDGKPWAEITYVDGKRHGLRRTWHSDGKPHEEETYVEGKRHGLCRTWWEAGQPCEEETWDHGKFVSTNLR